MKKFTYQLLLLFLISGVGSAQTPVMLKLGYETFDEVIKEHGLHYKATQDYDDYLKFRQSSLRKNAGLFSDTESISVPGIGGRVRSILVDSDNDIFLAAPSGGGLWTFAPDGSSFTAVDDMAPFMTITDITQSPFDSDEIIISTGDEYQGIIGEGLFISNDRGSTFVQLPSTDPDVENGFSVTRYVEYHPTRQNELYVVAGFRLYKSIDKGVSWNLVYQASDRIKSIEFNDSGEMLISVLRNGLFHSTTGDSGTFSQITNGVPNINGSFIGSVVASHKADRSIMYSLFSVSDPSSTCGSRADLYKSTDGGISWSFINSTDFCVTAEFFVLELYVHPTDPDLIFAGSIGWGYTENGGLDWIRGARLEVDYHEFITDISDPLSLIHISEPTRPY